MMFLALFTFLLCHSYLTLIRFNCWLCFKSQLKWNIPLEDFCQSSKSLLVLKHIPIVSDLVLTYSFCLFACLPHETMNFMRFQPYKYQRILTLPIFFLPTKLPLSSFSKKKKKRTLKLKK